MPCYRFAFREDRHANASSGPAGPAASMTRPGQPILYVDFEDVVLNRAEDDFGTGLP